MKTQHSQARYATEGTLKPFLSINYLLILFFFFLLSPTPTLAVEAITGASIAQENYSEISVEFFYEDGCLKCEQARPLIIKVVAEYPELNYSEQEIMISYVRMKDYGIGTVPTVMVNGNTAITYSDYEGNGTRLVALLMETIENAPGLSARGVSKKEISDDGSESGSGSGSGNEINSDNKTQYGISPLIILVAGLLAGFNPCLLAVMAFLASVTLSSGGNKKEMLKISAGFSAGIFVTYMLAGLSILGTLRFLPESQGSLTSFLVGITFFLGLWHIYDAYLLKIRLKSSFKTPSVLKKFMSEMNGKNLLSLSFVAGAIFSLVKAPCVGAVYISILNLLVTKTSVFEGAGYLALYNFGLVLPVVLLGALLAFGLDPETVTKFRKKKRAEIRLVTGLTLIALALLLHLKLI